MATVNVRVCPEGAVDTVFPNDTRKVLYYTIRSFAMLWDITILLIHSIERT